MEKRGVTGRPSFGGRRVLQYARLDILYNGVLEMILQEDETRRASATAL